MRLYSYVVARDYGFAPNPFNGWCTLATCKPRIRSSVAVDDWVIGTGAKSKYNLAGHLVFAMQVSETLTYDSYWNDPRFTAKKPVLNGSLKQVYGDNIYHREGERWTQENSHHSRENGRPNRDNVRLDTSANRVLVSRTFVYYGGEAPEIPAGFRPYKATGEEVCCPGQGHRVFASSLVEAFVSWLRKGDKWGLQGLPNEFGRQTMRRPLG